MTPTYISFNSRAFNLILISAFSLFFLICTFLFLLRKIVVKPILHFKNATKQVSEGNLDMEITHSSRDELGDLARSFNQMTDDLKKARGKIQKYSQKLEDLLDQKDAFIGQLGHDLKNPMQPLVGLLPIILEKEKDPKLKEHLRVIMNNVEYMKNLVFKTLDLARLRSPNTKLDFETVNLLHEIDTVLAAQQLFLQDHKIAVVNHVTNNFVVIADKLRLAELVTNIISNAVKYTPDGGGVITIDATKHHNQVTVSIKDTGVGMAQEQLEYVFDEFYKVDTSRHDMESSGLGLAICKRIVERHGGRIWVESTGVGHGSTFYFTLKAT